MESKVTNINPKLKSWITKVINDKELDKSSAGAQKPASGKIREASGV